MAAVLLTALLLACLATGIAAKYIRSVTWQSVVTFSADLAKSIELYEHEAEKQPDGSYKLTDEKVTGNTYTVMPGVDIPKDPCITIEGKSAIDAYLYIEVSDDISSVTGVYITYALEEHWMLLENVTGKQGGKVYVYSEDGTNPTVLDEAFSKETIGILKDNTVTVSHHTQNLPEFSMKFHGYMAQCIEGKTAAEVFTESF